MSVRCSTGMAQALRSFGILRPNADAFPFALDDGRDEVEALLCQIKACKKLFNAALLFHNVYAFFSLSLFFTMSAGYFNASFLISYVNSAKVSSHSFASSGSYS